MWKTPAIVVVIAALLSPPAAAQDARAVVRDASEEMGVAGLDAVTYSGVAAIGNFGQSRTISFGLAASSIQGYARTIDFTIPASRATGDLIAPSADGPAEPREYDEMVTPEFQAWAQQMQLWVTPWGFLRGAAAAADVSVRARTIDGVAYRVVSWSPTQRAPSGAAYRVNGYINAGNLVERVETWVDHPIVGDMHVEYRYSGYRPLHSVMVPERVAERRVGMETFVAEIRQFESNPPDVDELLALPPVDERRRLAAAPPSPSAASERLADGVYRVTGGYESLLVEFKDHVVVLEAPQSEQRGLALLAEARRLFPSKRVRYVVNSHAHFDHAEGLPPFVAEGVTIITDDTSRYFIEQALGQPRTLLADTLARARRTPRVEGVLESRVLTDGTRTIELHHVPMLDHSDGMLIAWLPKERILFTTDFDAAATIERLGLKVERHVQAH